jgi:protein LTV1
MPEDVLPSHPLDEVSYDKIMASKAPERGLMPDLDPSIREVLEALDDEAYAADDGTGTDDEDEFWNGVLEGGEVQDKSEQVWDDEEADETAGVAKGVEKLALDGHEGQDDASDQWAAFKRFKATGGGAAEASDDEDDEDYGSEGGDTIADLRATLATANGPARKSGMSAAGSAFSMSSSAMFRNEQLRTLDDRFDQVRGSHLAYLFSKLRRCPCRSRSFTTRSRTTRGAADRTRTKDPTRRSCLKAPPATTSSG